MYIHNTGFGFAIFTAQGKWVQEYTTEDEAYEALNEIRESWS